MLRSCRPIPNGSGDATPLERYCLSTLQEERSCAGGVSSPIIQGWWWCGIANEYYAIHDNLGWAVAFSQEIAYLPLILVVFVIYREQQRQYDVFVEQEQHMRKNKRGQEKEGGRNIPL